ncbi:MAG: type II toxin-antitoxin system VapC family toxin [Geminicoccaceae bacterium]
MQIVADTSSLLAVLLGESEREVFHDVLLNHNVLMSVVSITEMTVVLHARRGRRALTRMDRALERYRVTPAGVREEDLALLRQALLDFGRGRRRAPAALNFGDLFAYALAKRLGVPLLCKGDDFARTDVQPALS